jgi:AcrR family transcriptional regulator
MAAGGARTASRTTRERVLEAARQTLAAQGYAATTARTIAATGGFAPGVIYYHFADLDQLMVAVAGFSSDEREERYRAAVLGVTSAKVLIERLRVLYDEDVGAGHVAAVQELISAARPGTPLADAVSAHVRRWEGIAEQVLRDLLRGTPFARLVKVPVAARAVVAYYLGMQTLTRIDEDSSRPDAAFAQAARLAAAFDRLPRLRRGGSAGSSEA